MASIATPFNSIARSSESSDSGIKPFWKAKPEHEQIGRDRVAQQRGGEPGGVDEVRAAADRFVDQGADLFATGTASRDFARTAPAAARWVLMTATVRPGRVLEMASVRAGGEHVAAQNQVRFAGGDALGVDVFAARARCAHAR